MLKSSVAPSTAFLPDDDESARLRSAYAGNLLKRNQLWRRSALQRRLVHGLIAIAILTNLIWLIGLDQVMAPLMDVSADRRPIEVTIISPPEVFEIPAEPEPEPVPVEFKKRPSKIQIQPPVATSTPPPLNSQTSSQTQARIGTAGQPELNLFNADGSLRMPKTTIRIGPKKIDNPQEAAKAQWAEIQSRGENPLDCKKTRFANAFRRDESLGDKVSRKYLSWIGLADGAVIAERAAAKQRRANEGCDPAD